MPQTETYVTIIDGAPKPYVVWRDTNVLCGFFTPETLPEDYAQGPWWRFTADTSMVPRTLVNGTGYPVVDAENRPLWQDCRIELRFGTVGNSETVTGRYRGTREHAITDVLTDRPVRKTGWNPRIGTIMLPDSTEHTLTASTFVREDPIRNHLRLSAERGDHDRGFETHYIRLLDDPRHACLRTRRPRRKAHAGR
jgi:hypothetical protein